MPTKKPRQRAFPTAGGEYGMELRDYFAGQALIACMSSPPWVKGMDAAAAACGTTLAEAVAEMVYQYADVMMVERER